MDVIKDHLVLLLDGFNSHCDVDTLLESFTKYTILVVKEKGNTSQVLKAYDQDVAKSDKRCTRELLDGYICHIKYKIIQ